MSDYGPLGRISGDSILHLYLAIIYRALPVAAMMELLNPGSLEAKEKVKRQKDESKGPGSFDF